MSLKTRRFCKIITIFIMKVPYLYSPRSMIIIALIKRLWIQLLWKMSSSWYRLDYFRRVKIVFTLPKRFFWKFLIGNFSWKIKLERLPLNSIPIKWKKSHKVFRSIGTKRHTILSINTHWLHQIQHWKDPKNLQKIKNQEFNLKSKR